MATSKKLSPRQKMINLMYLVLIALLALNVSKEILNAFKIVNTGIETSNETLKNRNSQYYQSIEKLAQNDPRIENLNIKQLSEETKNLTTNILNYIKELQDDIKEISGTKDVEGEIVFKKPEDLNTTTKLLADENTGKGEELRQKLELLRHDYLKIIDEGNLTVKGTEAYTDYKDLYASLIPLQEQPEQIRGLGNELKSWSRFNFGNIPVIAGNVILEKLKGDIINTETLVLEYLLEQAKADIIDFDVLEAKVIAPKSYLSAGTPYQADIFISAASSKTVMEVFVGEIDIEKFNGKDKIFAQDASLPFIGDYEKIEVENGKARLEKPTTSSGVKNYEGIIRVNKPQGGYDLYPFYGDYEVAPPAGYSVSPTKMNVLYIGVENPIDIAVSGAKNDSDVRASISDGNLIKRSAGKYIAKVNKPGTVTINVSATIDDKVKSFTPMEFRVLRIPDPKITLCGKPTSEKMNKNQLLACTGLVPKNDDFVFEDRFNVVSFDIKISNSDGLKTLDNKGPLFSNKANDLFRNLSKNDVVIFNNIKVKDPANNLRKLDGSVFIEIL